MSTNEPNLPPDASSASLFAEGQKLAGCYALSRRLTVGDGPEVWLATDEVLGKEVSLHILPAAITKDAAALQEVRAEVKRNRQLINPQILRVFDLIEEPQWAAVSMNTFEGESLAYRLSKQPEKRFAATEVEEWVSKLIQTIEDAHRIHFLHRDLAPENIFLTPAGQPLVAYFAISRKIQDALARLGAADEARLAYVSPQTLAGQEPARTDDVYSLAAVFYTVLVGAPPFVGGNVAAQVQAGVTPETLSALGRENLHIPPAWREAIAAGLRSSPKGRPQSAAEFLKILKGEASAPASVDSEEEKAPTPGTAPAAPEVPVVVPAPVPVPAAKAEAPAPAAAPAPPAPPVPVAPPPAAAPVEPVPKAEEVKKEEVVAPIITPPPVEKLEAVVNPEPKAETVAPEAKPEVAAPEAKPIVVESKLAEPEVKPAVVEPAPAKPEPSPAVPVPAPAALVSPAAPAAPATPPASAPATPGTPAAPAPATPPAPAAPAAPVPPSPTEPKKPTEPAITASSETVPPKVEPKKLESITAPAEVLPPRVEPKKPAAPQGPGTADVMPPRGPVSKPYQRPPLTEFKPRLYPEESRRMSYLIGGGALVLVALGIYFLSTTGKKTSFQESHSSTPVAMPSPTPAKEDVHETKTPAPTVIVANGTPAPVSTPPPPPAATPPPAPTPAPPNSTSPANLQKVVAEKQAALDQAKQAVAAAEKAHADRLKAQQTAEAAVVDSQRAVETKAKSNDVVKASVADIASQRQKLEDSQKTAQAAAEQAQKLAEEKARVVEQGKKALDDLEKEKSDKLAVQDKANAELTALQQTLAEKQHAAAEAAKAVADAEAARQQQLAAVNKNEQELASAKSALEMHDSLESKLEIFRKMQNGGATPAPAPAPAATPMPTPVKAATPAPPVPPLPATPAPTTSLPATPAPSTPVATAPAATQVPGANSLGMKFVPVGDVEFAVWLVRLQDFRIFAKAVNLKSTSWESPGFKQEPDHPVVNVTWIEALAFCKWLTDKEHREGILPANQYYRLPTDLEWSKAVGLPEETGKTPEQRDMGVPDVYPWGTEWPPPKGAGNYTGEETGSDVAIKGYDDGYAWTSPVGSFKPNKYGLYDMGGNVWQWCMDSWNTESKAKVLRGASWYNGALKLSLLSSCRVHAAPDSSTDNYGFRLVRATESAGAVKGRFR